MLLAAAERLREVFFLFFFFFGRRGVVERPGSLTRGGVRPLLSSHLSLGFLPRESLRICVFLLFSFARIAESTGWLKILKIKSVSDSKVSVSASGVWFAWSHKHVQFILLRRVFGMPRTTP